MSDPLRKQAKLLVDCTGCGGAGKSIGNGEDCHACKDREAGVGDGDRVRGSVYEALHEQAGAILAIVESHDADEEDERGCRCGHDRDAHDFRYEDAEPCSDAECFCASYRPRDVPFKIRERFGLEAE